MFALIAIGAIWIAEPLLDKLESLVLRVGGTGIKWIVEPDFLVTILLMAVLLVVVCGIPAIFFGVLYRIAGIAIYRREIETIKGRYPFPAQIPVCPQAPGIHHRGPHG